MSAHGLLTERLWSVEKPPRVKARGGGVDRRKGSSSAMGANMKKVKLC
jgi:hypothetical protein